MPERLLCADARELRSRAHVTSSPFGRDCIQDSARDTLPEQDFQEELSEGAHILASLPWPRQVDHQGPRGISMSSASSPPVWTEQKKQSMQ
ncbi:hypothetical protein D0861_07763 [Hortaea werneckii]|uniref:Uncharacterized protein n=1 Tax=Hortaea werneckii TaxID=91943 RepID=A0A3M7F2C4_HORWE|nr:hypothetical protein D0861_07763 [Hortaea werneckii]